MDWLGLFLGDWLGLDLPDGTKSAGYFLGQCPHCGRQPSLQVGSRTVDAAAGKSKIRIMYFYCDPCDTNYSFQTLPEARTDDPQALLYKYNQIE